MMFEDKIVYQVYPKSFQDSNGDGIGDLPGIIRRLDYLADLGIDYLWLSPVNRSPQCDNGYDISDYEDIDPMFGTLDDYKRLIDEAGRRNIKLMVDLVLNHTSAEHEWFRKAVAGDEAFRDYYVWRDEPNELRSIFGGSAWTYHEKVGRYYLHLFDKHQPDLNWENPVVREAMQKVVNFWIELGVGGFRLDVINLIGKEPDKLITGNGPNFYRYMRELADATFGDRLLTVGECWGSTPDDARAMSEAGLTQIFHFEHLVQTNVGNKWTQQPLDYQAIVAIIRKWQNDYSGSQTWVMNNHDRPRLISLWGNDDAYRYACATCFATLFGLLRGTQYIYQGEEIGMPNAYFDSIEQYNDVETLNAYRKLTSEDGLSPEDAMASIRLVSRDNARIPMQWDDSPTRGFTTGTPWLGFGTRHAEANAKADLAADPSVYRFYQQLIAFRKENHARSIDHPLDDIAFDGHVIHYRKGDIEVICNVSETIVSEAPSGEVLLSNYEDRSALHPYQAVVVRVEV